MYRSSLVTQDSPRVHDFDPATASQDRPGAEDQVEPRSWCLASDRHPVLRAPHLIPVYNLARQMDSGHTEILCSVEAPAVTQISGSSCREDPAAFSTGSKGVSGKQ